MEPFCTEIDPNIKIILTSFTAGVERSARLISNMSNEENLITNKGNFKNYEISCRKRSNEKRLL